MFDAEISKDFVAIFVLRSIWKDKTGISFRLALTSSGYFSGGAARIGLHRRKPTISLNYHEMLAILPYDQRLVREEAVLDDRADQIQSVVWDSVEMLSDSLLDFLAVAPSYRPTEARIFRIKAQRTNIDFLVFRFAG